MGHDVDATDVLNDYMDRCEYTYRLMEKRGRSMGKDWPQEEKDWTADVKQRWDTLKSGTTDTKVSFTKRLLAKMKAKFCTPSRSLPLTVQEEKIRCEETWKAFDYALWLAGCADKAGWPILSPIQNSSSYTERIHGCFSLIRYLSG